MHVGSASVNVTPWEAVVRDCSAAASRTESATRADGIMLTSSSGLCFAQATVATHATATHHEYSDTAGRFMPTSDPQWLSCEQARRASVLLSIVCTCDDERQRRFPYRGGS
jgi:hypothetical protein